MAEEWKEGAWRITKAQSLISMYKQGSVDVSSLDPLVARLLLYFIDNRSDSEIGFIIDLKKQKPYLVNDMVHRYIEGNSVKEIADEYSFDVSHVELLVEIFCSFDKRGGKEYSYIDYAKNLSPTEKKRLVLQRKFGKFYDPIAKGMPGTKPLSQKDIMDMVYHAAQKSFIMSQLGDGVELDAPEQKTILAYNKVFQDYISLIKDLEAENTDSNVLMKRMAQYTSRIPTTIPKIPAIKELERAAEFNGLEFRLAPKEDLADDI